MKKLFLSSLFSFLTIGLWSQTPNFVFESGFEGTSTLTQFFLNGTPDPNYADITGEDNGYDWELDLDNSPNIGSFRIYYEIGDTSKTIAEIIPEPGNTSNNVLSFNVKQSTITYIANNGATLEKGRIQAAINGNPNLHEFNVQTKLYIHDDFDSLINQALPFNWLTIQEFWNNASNAAFPFRVTLNLEKFTGIGEPLHIRAHGQTKITTGVWDTKWDDMDSNFVIPIGEWFTIDTYFLEGDSLNGQFKVTITDNLNNSTEIINITGFTHHPNDPNPDGVSSFNPMKLYTSGELIDYMDSLNANLCFYWDDFKFWTNNLLAISNLESIESKVFYYPNPVQSILKYNSKKEVLQIEIYNPNGQLIKNIKPSSTTEIDLKFLQKGMFLLRFIYKDGESKVVRIQK